MKSITLKKNDSKLESLVYKTNKENTFDSRWSEVKISGKNIYSRSSHVAVFVESKMYVHGGYDTDKGILSDFHCIDLTSTNQQFEWVTLPNKINAQTIRLKAHTAVTYKNNIYLFGGEKAFTENSNVVYAYDTKIKKWSQPTIIGQNKIPKIDSHCAIIHGENMIVYGGYVASQATFVSNIYSLNLQKLQWTQIQTQSIKPPCRSSSAMVTYGDCLYIFGGTTGQKTLNDMWKFNLKERKWQKIQCQTLPQARRGHSMIVYKQCIFLFGGIKDITKQKNDMYIFDFKNQNWNKIHTFTNSVYDCSPTLKKGKRDGSISPEKHLLKSSSLDKSSLNNDGMRKILAENKQKKFLQKKKDLLKQFNEKLDQTSKKRTFSPTTQSMIKTLQSIGIQESNNSQFPHQIIYDESRKFIIGKKPCARDGQTVSVWQNKMYIFGGDRHLMSFNDMYQFDLDKGIKSLQLYRTK